MAEEKAPLYGTGMVKIELWDGIVEEVYVDEKAGPKVFRMDGSYIDYRTSVGVPWKVVNGEGYFGPTWPELSATHQTCVLHLVAKVNRKLKERLGMV
mmetsp:Transcript_16793/g.46237  ORF Transcript_16793/g.46237 Transcript_16793/m.46237 type:complete len:97 (+) Transcript_16793:76-366(+)|eukprot:CAMPEP_0179023696 /NCGR_PEP_ID=MMETSP0796-20121207/7064_1 /TAXON_ID=73915 /ORGANISM="Pyrodinium bahamense, Strain pbaha01" /LENGTH=96 /DNA_ID=CAMNT_0020719617 /DNA_START=76 /DNA_END=366 /DNA_ORIENTATION=-